MKICEKCIIPDSFPNITFDNGVCGFCRDSERSTKNEIAKGYSRLREILRSGKAETYDCIVPVSGGKDSSYMLYYTVRELGLKPLALFFDSGFTNELSKKNVENICRKLSVDLIVVKSTNFRRKAVREALHTSEYTNRFLQQKGECGNCENNLRTAAINEATKRKIPFILWGHAKLELAPNRYEKTRPFRGFAERKSIKRFINHIYTYSLLMRGRTSLVDRMRMLKHKLKYDYYIIRDNFASKAPEGWRKFMPFLEVSFKNKKVQTIYLYDYVPYNPFKHMEVLRRELAWQAPSDKETKMDCKLHCLPNYDFLRRTGITMDGVYLANLVRKGLLTRADAMRREETMKKDIARECQETLKELGFDNSIIYKEVTEIDWKL